jgi:uncharacterized protein
VELSHSFVVPASMTETWEAFQDIESVAGCFPGATVTSVEGDTFIGSCKVKLGPISLVYSGEGKFLEKDEASRRFVIEAKGKDKRGNGTAGANVTVTFAEEGGSSTKVDVLTDLAITGKPAQFGRGVMQDVSDKLLQQFVTCLQSRVGAPDAAAVDPPPAEEAPAEEAPAKKAPAKKAAAKKAPAKQAAAAKAPAKRATAAKATAAKAPPPPPTPPPTPAPTLRPPAPAYAAPDNDVLDLGATVLPVLLKTYWKELAGVVVALILLRKLLSHRN